jgi:hypothetical protein
MRFDPSFTRMPELPPGSFNDFALIVNDLVLIFSCVTQLQDLLFSMILH